MNDFGILVSHETNFNENTLQRRSPTISPNLNNLKRVISRMIDSLYHILTASKPELVEFQPIKSINRYFHENYFSNLCIPFQIVSQSLQGNDHFIFLGSHLHNFAVLFDRRHKL